MQLYSVPSRILGCSFFYVVTFKMNDPATESELLKSWIFAERFLSFYRPLNLKHKRIVHFSKRRLVLELQLVIIFIVIVNLVIIWRLKYKKQQLMLFLVFTQSLKNSFSKHLVLNFRGLIFSSGSELVSVNPCQGRRGPVDSDTLIV